MSARGKRENPIKATVSAINSVLNADNAAKIVAIWLLFLNFKNILHSIATKL
ncbi:hypothetical protein QT972_21915 [Microcoleus sp. herbarium7]|uniref:hypothetical protein n=1 Tax=unclassified Microcoleus TaxID=2642155 RepID=UPI002FD2506A